MTEPTLRPFRLPLLRKPQHKAAENSATARPAAPATTPASSASSNSTKLHPPATRSHTPCSTPVISSNSKRLKTLPAPMLLQSPAASTMPQSLCHAAAGQQQTSAGQAASAAARQGAATDACLLQLPSLKRRRLAVPMTTAGASQGVAAAAGSAANAAKHPAAATVLAHPLEVGPSSATVGAPLAALVTSRLAPTTARAGGATVKRRRSVQLQPQTAEAGAASTAALTTESGTAASHAAPPSSATGTTSAVPAISFEAAAQSPEAVAPVLETKMQPTTGVEADVGLSSASSAAAAQCMATAVTAVASTALCPAQGQQESNSTVLGPAAAAAVAGEPSVQQVLHQLLQDQSEGPSDAVACRTADKRHNMQQLQPQVGLQDMETSTAVVTADLADAGLDTLTVAAAAADIGQRPTAHRAAKTAVTLQAPDCSAAASHGNCKSGSSGKLTQQHGAVACLSDQLPDMCKDTADHASDVGNSKQPPQLDAAKTVPCHLQDKCKYITVNAQLACRDKQLQHQGQGAAVTLPSHLQKAPAVGPAYLQDATAVVPDELQDKCDAFHTSSKHIKECLAPATLPGHLQDKCKDTANLQDFCNSTAAGAAAAVQSFAAESAAAEPGLLGPAVRLPGDTVTKVVVESRSEAPSAAAAAAVLMNGSKQSTSAAARAMSSHKLPQTGDSAAAPGEAAATGAAVVALPGTTVQHCASKAPASPPPAGPETAAGSNHRLVEGAAKLILVSSVLQSPQTAASAHSKAWGSAAAAADAVGPQVAGVQAAAAAAVASESAAAFTPAAIAVAGPVQKAKAPPSPASAGKAVCCTTQPTAAAVSGAMLGQEQPVIPSIVIPTTQSLQTLGRQAVGSQAAGESEQQPSQQVRLPPPGDLPTIWAAGFSRELPGLKQLTGRLPHRKPPASVPDTLDQLVPQQQALAAAQQTLWRSMMPRKLPASAAVARQQQQRCHKVSSRYGNLAATTAAVGRPQHLQDTEGCRKVACSRLLRVAVLEACRKEDSDQQQQQQQHQCSGAAGSWTEQKRSTEEMVDPAVCVQPQQQQQQQHQFSGVAGSWSKQRGVTKKRVDSAVYVQPQQQQQHQTCGTAGSWTAQQVVTGKMVDPAAYIQPQQQQQQQQHHQFSGAAGSWSEQRGVTEAILDPAAYSQPQQQQQQGQWQHMELQHMHLAGQQQQHQQWLGVNAFAMQQEQMNTSWQHCSSSSDDRFGSSILRSHDESTISEAAAETWQHHETSAPQNGTATLKTPAAVLQEQHHRGAKLPGVTDSAAYVGSCEEGVRKPAVGQGQCAMVANSVCEIAASQLALPLAAVDFEDCDAMLSALAALME